MGSEQEGQGPGSGGAEVEEEKARLEEDGDHRRDFRAALKTMFVRKEVDLNRHGTGSVGTEKFRLECGYGLYTSPNNIDAFSAGRPAGRSEGKTSSTSDDDDGGDY